MAACGGPGRDHEPSDDTPSPDNDHPLLADGIGERLEPRGVAVRRRRGRLLVVFGLVGFALLAAVASAMYVVSEKLADNVERVPDVFGPIEEEVRPPASEALTFLLVGTDTRAEAPTTGADASAPSSGRSDALMIAHVDAERAAASVVSIPRDSWVKIPGHGMNKINAAYAFGGPSLLIQTVENLTGLRIDHFAVIDFAGFEAMVNAVGGIAVGISAPTSDRGVEFHQGVNHLNGAEALVYVRQRDGLPDGDLDRAQRQQNALRALVAKAASTGMLTDPAGLYELLDAVTRSVTVDDTLSNGGLRSLVFELGALRPNDMIFLTAPVAGVGNEGEQSVVYLDRAPAGELWTALRDEKVESYADRYPSDALGTVTR